MHQRKASPPCHSTFINAKVQHCSKLYGSSALSTNNGTNVGLADAYDAVWNGVYFVPLHVLLLSVNRPEHFVSSASFGRKFSSFIQHPFHLSKVTAHILKLLFDRLANLFRRALFALCEVQVISSRIPAVGSWPVVTVFVTKFVNHSFKVLPNLV